MLDGLLNSKAIADKINIAIDGGNLTHAITVAHGTDEQLYLKYKTNIYSLSCFRFRCLSFCWRGSVVTVKLYNKIDGSIIVIKL